MENDLKKKIRDSAENLEIPESLLPENVEERLSGLGEQSRAEERRTRRGPARRLFPAVYGVSAAVLLLFGCYALFRTGLIEEDASLIGGARQEAGMDGAGPVNGEENPEEEQQSAGQTSETPSEEASVQASGKEAAREARLLEAKKDAGDLYTVASNYKEVYDLLQKWEIEKGRDFIELYPMEPAEAPMVSGREALTITDGTVAMVEETGESSFSVTNTQVEGVDESDIIKTDGVCIYTIKENKVYITDIRGGELSPAAVLDPTRQEQMGTVQEIYVDEDRLIVIASSYESRLEEYGDAVLQGDEASICALPTLSGEYGDAVLQESEASLQRGVADQGVSYRMVNEKSTVLYIYDTSDKTAPRLLGTVRQDGEYRNSRKIGDIVYLFSWEYRPGIRQGSEWEDLDWVPQVNEAYIPADHIYLSENGSSALLISSLDIGHPGRVLDEVMILCNDEIYLTAKSLYLYRTDYTAGLQGGSATQIARFALEDGVIDAVGAAMAEGSVTDTFAVNESGTSFRVLTTCRKNDGTVDNALTIFDLELQKKGALTGLAPGETIYSARFFENMAYFVTYRNMDPLFAVDLSDERQPKVLGELELTGYSEYLHLWGEDKLLGIGLETDPQSGKRLGIKMSMFDISDPARLQVLDSVVLKDKNYSPALDQYKTVLVSPGESLIGFAAGYESPSYLVYRWEEGGFRLLLEKQWEEGGRFLNEIRGLYAGDVFYIASPNRIVSFDRKNGYQEICALEM